MSEKSANSSKLDWRNPAIIVAIITLVGVITVPILNSYLKNLELHNSIKLTTESEIASDRFDELHGLFSIEFPKNQFILDSYLITDPYIDYTFHSISDNINFEIIIAFTTYSATLSDNDFIELSQLNIDFDNNPNSVLSDLQSVLSNNGVYSLEKTNRLAHSILSKEIVSSGNNLFDENFHTIRLLEESNGIVLNLIILVDEDQYLKYEDEIQAMIESFTWNPDIVRDLNYDFSD